MDGWTLTALFAPPILVALAYWVIWATKGLEGLLSKQTVVAFASFEIAIMLLYLPFTVFTEGASVETFVEISSTLLAVTGLIVPIVLLSIVFRIIRDILT